MNMKRGCIKICMSILFIAIITFAKPNKIKATYWPIGGINSNETRIEYNRGKNYYTSDGYVKMCKQNYNIDVYEQKYNKNIMSYGVEIIGIPGHIYSVVSIVDGVVISTSANKVNNASTNYVNRNCRNSSLDGGGYGNYVVIQESSTGKCFVYGYLKAGSITVTKGNRVTKGQQIGIMGSSGKAGHMSLLFQVRKNISVMLKNPSADKSDFVGLNLNNYENYTENPLSYIGTENNKLYQIFKKVKATPSELTQYGVLYDYEYYVAHKKNVRDCYGNDGSEESRRNVMIHFFTIGIYEGDQAGPYFSVVDYINSNSDIANYCKTGTDSNGNPTYDYTKALIHYCQYGYNEGRVAISEHDTIFNPVYYANKYPELKSVYGNNATGLLDHFIRWGMKAGLQASAEFNVNAYRNRYSEYQKLYKDSLLSYYWHYARWGAVAGLKGI